MTKTPKLKIKPFLKWPGGKYQIIDKITAVLPTGKKLIEPFVGSGSVFLNTDYDKYVLNDINYDLINIYKTLKLHGKDFISLCKTYFKPRYNKSTFYYKLRKNFNELEYNEERAALFLYLNRHGYNGLCRYNKSKKEYNVPFGSYNKPYFPEQEMLFFHKKSYKATFFCVPFQEIMKRAKKNDTVYCDPPYVPLSKTSNFTSYAPLAFTLDEHIILSELAKQLSNRGVNVVLSNHFTQFTKEIYAGAKLFKFDVKRYIGCNAESRKDIKEILAVFSKL